MKIAILGAGAFGTALGGVLADKGYDIDYYDVEIEKERLMDVLVKAKYIVLAVPSNVAPHLLPWIPKNIPLIVATKGFLDMHNFEGFRDVMVISGPGFAQDIKAGKPTKLTATDMRVVDLFGTERLTFDYTVDKLGVLMCGALKNVYAIYAGKLNLERDSQEYEQYIETAAEEMREILALNGAEAATVDFECGVGDLRLTCGLPSRNFEFGLMLAKNPAAKPEQTVEGITTLERIRRGQIRVPENAQILREMMAWD